MAGAIKVSNASRSNVSRTRSGERRVLLARARLGPQCYGTDMGWDTGPSGRKAGCFDVHAFQGSFGTIGNADQQCLATAVVGFARRDGCCLRFDTGTDLTFGQIDDKNVSSGVRYPSFRFGSLGCASAMIAGCSKTRLARKAATAYNGGGGT